MIYLVEKENLSVMIDWVQVTFKDKDLDLIFHAGLENWLPFVGVTL